MGKKDYESDSDSDFSDDSAHNEEDTKMRKLLAEWDAKDDEKDDLYIDSDDESDDDEEEKKAALRKLKVDKELSEEEDDDDDDDEDEDDDVEAIRDDDDEEEEEEEYEIESPAAVQYDDEDDILDTKTVATEITEDDDDPAPIIDKLKKKPKNKAEKRKVKSVTEPNEDDDEEAAAMKALLASWDADHNAAESDNDSDDSDDDSEASEREVVLEDNVLDHIVLAHSDLDEGIDEFEKKTGVKPVIAGTIKGLGIKCARVSFNDATYLEIIAPDPKAPGPIGELVKGKKLKELAPFHYAIRTNRAEALKDEVVKFGYTPDHITMFGAKADGTPRKWEMLYLYGHKLGGICPFFINWSNSDHPCATLPVVGELKKITIRAPEDDNVHKLYAHVGIQGIRLEKGKPKISFSFKSPEGTVKFDTKKAVGFKFPGFEADVGTIPGDDGEQDCDVEFEAPAMPDLLPVSDDDYDAIPEPYM